ncbi:MAG: hypothetical protein A3K09_06840 [Nitrospinae bacterium RIFCSPLOWO2_12_FULL_47_7]|nr:MAG: hypothetical protein A3K09_06840 [Nitrospinae bacterium RIFCSPLOWO2_12_FULL_47_7]
MEEINLTPVPQEQLTTEVPTPDGENEIDLNVLFPGEENDLNQLFPEAEMKHLLKKVSKNKKELHLMVDRFTEISEPD